MLLDWNMVIGLAAILGLIVPVIIGVFQIRQAQLTSQVQVLLKLDDNFWSDEMRNVRVTCVKRIKANGGFDDQDEEIIDYFSYVGTLVNKGALDVELAAASMAYWAVYYYVIFEKYPNLDSYWDTYKSLIDRFCKVKGYEEFNSISEKQVREFIDYEIRRLSAKSLK